MRGSMEDGGALPLDRSKVAACLQHKQNTDQ